MPTFNLLNTGCANTPGTFGELWSILDANTDDFWINTYVPSNGSISFDNFGGGTDTFNFPYFEDRLISGITYTWPFFGDYCTVDTTGGVFQFDGQLQIYLAQTIAVAPNATAFDRIDIIAIDPLGTLIVIAGTPAAIPAAPPLGTNLLYGYMLVPATTICASNTIVFTFLGYNKNGLGAGINPGDVLTWNGGIWVSQAPIFSFPAQAINWLTDVNTTAPSVGQILSWNGANWINSSIGVIPVGTTTHSTLRWSGAAWLESVNFRNTNEAIFWSGNSSTAGYPTGTGTRYMFISDKQALRAGSIVGTNWDAAQIGLGTVAMGINVSALAANSAVFGKDNYIIAGGISSFVAGENNTLSSAYSSIFGTGNFNTGANQSFVFGKTITFVPSGTSNNNFIAGYKITASTSGVSNNVIFANDSSGAGSLTFNLSNAQNNYVFQDNTIARIISGNGNAMVFGRDVSITQQNNLTKALFCDNVSISAYTQRLSLIACRNLTISSWIAAYENNILIGLDNTMTTGFAFNLQDTVSVSRLKLFGMIIHSVYIHNSGTVTPGAATSPMTSTNFDKSVIFAAPGTSVTLPGSPAIGQQLMIKRNGSVGATTTIIGGAYPIDASGTYTLGTPWASVILIFSGTYWGIF